MPAGEHNSGTSASRGTYSGLLLVATATLMYEILLTRIFSVTMWYHFAFVAISVAMFGMTVGAIIVYVLPGVFRPERVHSQLAVGSLVFAAAVVTSFLSHLSVPFVAQKSIVGIYALAFNYLLLALPFIAGGVVVCLALTRFPRQVGSLYGADLAGAALGCVILVGVLSITDGSTGVFVVAMVAALAAWAFSVGTSSRRVRVWAAVMALSLGVFSVGNTILVARQAGLVRPIWVKGRIEPRPLYEVWNSYSRVAVVDDQFSGQPEGANMSSATPDTTVEFLRLTIDASASTLLTRYGGDPAEIDYLRYDVINTAHHLRDAARVLVVGTGGGRDVLGALAFGPSAVTGVEINADILRVVNDTFGKYTGHLDRDPRVTFVNDEARAYVSGQRDRFDVIQVSFIDTWAATAAGAYVLTENTLYTVEAWESFLRALAPRGILTFSRWYNRREPGAIYRLTALAAESLNRLGVADPRQHIVVVRNMTDAQVADGPDGVGTILVSRDPYSRADLERLAQVTRRLGYEIVVSPGLAIDDLFAQLAAGRDLGRIISQHPLDISAPTDDRPFFFHLLRMRELLAGNFDEQGRMTFNQRAVYILVALLAIVTVLTLACIILPVTLAKVPPPPRSALPLLAFFAAIGFGFMLVEISQLQRLNIFLGHPTYGLVVVLFTVLLASGVGSLLTQRVIDRRGHGAYLWPLVGLITVLLLTGLGTPILTAAFRGAATHVRVLVAVAIMVPMGLLMGAPFPLGMTRAARDYPAQSPWFWGINGATSVTASVLAMVIALFAGISSAFWVGTACYLAAMSALWASSRGDKADAAR